MPKLELSTEGVFAIATAGIFAFPASLASWSDKKNLPLRTPSA